jgi:hypothetical protein
MSQGATATPEQTEEREEERGSQAPRLTESQIHERSQLYESMFEVQYGSGEVDPPVVFVNNEPIPVNFDESCSDRIQELINENNIEQPIVNIMDREGNIQEYVGPTAVPDTFEDVCAVGILENG